jgi:hypothetical protein
MNLKTSLVSIIGPTQPERAQPQPPMTLPDGKWVGLDYPRRIPPLHRRGLRRWQRGVLALIRVLAGETYDYTCFRVTARLPGKVMPLHTLFFTQLLQHGRIPGADSERIVIRVAWRAGGQYEYAHHTRMALALLGRGGVHGQTNFSLWGEMAGRNVGSGSFGSPTLRPATLLGSQPVSSRHLGWREPGT